MLWFVAENITHSFCNNGKICTLKAIIDLLKDFTSSLVPRGHSKIGWANKTGILLFIVGHTAKPLYHTIVNKAVKISMRFICNLLVFNLFELSACHTPPRVHEMRVMSGSQSHPVREVFSCNTIASASPCYSSVSKSLPVCKRTSSFG